MLRLVLGALLSVVCGCCDLKSCATSLARDDDAEGGAVGMMIQLPYAIGQTGHNPMQLQNKSVEIHQTKKGMVMGLLVVILFACGFAAYTPTGVCSALPEEAIAPSVDTQRGRSPVGAFLDILNIFTGAGILHVPLALHHAGWFGLFLITFLAIFMAICSQLLVKSIRHCERRENSVDDVIEYATMAHEAFGTLGAALVDVCLAAEMLSLCGWWFAVMLKLVQYYFELQFMWAVLAIWLLTVTVNAVPEGFVVIVASGGFVSLMVCFVTVWITGLNLPHRDAPGQHLIGDSASILVLIGVILSCYSGVAYVPHLYSKCSQRTKEMYTGVVWAGSIGAGILLALFGVLALHFFGSQVKDVAILNAGRYLDGSPLPQLSWLNGVAVASTFMKLSILVPMSGEPIATLLLRNFWPGEDRPHNLTIHVVIVLALATAVFAERALLIFVAFMGDVLTLSNNVIVPALLHSRLEGFGANAGTWSFIMCSTVFSVFVCACCVASTSQSAMGAAEPPFGLLVQLTIDR